MNINIKKKWRIFLGLTVNMSHFITTVESGILSYITIKFKEQVDLKINYACVTIYNNLEYYFQD